jgi:hypothetical protein
MNSLGLVDVGDGKEWREELDEPSKLVVDFLFFLEMPLINYGINIIEFSNMSKNIANYHHIK